MTKFVFNRIQWIFAVMLLIVTVQVRAQNYPPQKVTTPSDTRDYYRHGSNKTDPTSTDIPQELRDSVTITSTQSYFVLPDTSISPNWYNTDETIKDISNTSNLNSTFTWSLENHFGALFGSSTTYTETGRVSPILQIQWGATTGSDILRMREVPKTNTACIIGTGTAITIDVIAKPIITFDQVGNPLAYAAGGCYTQAEVTAGVVYNFPVTVTTAVPKQAQIKIDYTVTRMPGESSGAMPSNGNDVSITVDASGKATFPLEFLSYGVYKITLTDVTDRISRKSQVAVAGVIVSAGSEFIFSVLRPAETGPIYRLPNNY
ncbi:MAG: hypothetical protein LBS09_01520 [Bacteroidales bacterium]|jgi:hypothetical protein|nr:hypothetical protein [Bacteroidales bacterium]